MQRWIEAFLVVSVLAMTAACGGPNTLDVTNQPPPNGQPITISFDPAPPDTISQNAIAAVTAVVAQDSTDAGVDWAFSCEGNTDCGSLSPLHTSSGTPSTYTPPATFTGNQLNVTITAFASADHTKNVATPLAVTGFGGNLKGTYILQTVGTDETGLGYQFAAAVVLDGNGNITSGEQNYVNTTKAVASDVTSGSYSIGPDGRGTLVLNVPNKGLGQGGVENFSLVFLSSSRCLITKLDDLSLPTTSTETAVGTMDLQTSQTAPAGGYAFAMNGADVFVQADAIGGILNIDSPGTISGTGSVADQNLAGTLIKKAAITGTVSDPDSFGVVKFVLHTPISPAAIRLTGYIVDATHIKLIETDLNVNNGTGASTGGVAIAQGAATGTFTDNSALSGRFVVALQGTDLSGISGTLTAAGTFTSDGAGKFTSGFLDETLLGIGIQIDDQMTATYGVDPSGNGRTAANIKFKNNGPGPQFIFYLTGNGNPPLFLDSDITFGAVGFGTAYPAVDATFDGKYGIGYTQNVFGSETDATGPVTVDGTAQTITGFVDTNFFFTPVPNTVISGTFATTNFPGRLKGNLTNELFQVAPDGGIAVNYYMYDSDHGVFVENDSLDTSQVTFGSFVRRTPVCPDCP